jgi:undecaprenyl-diphosphatase
METMDWLHALILGLVQGLTEYLPVSSSGHLELGRRLLGMETEGGLTFDIIVHVATVLATLVILHREVTWIFRGLFRAPIPAAAAPQKSLWQRLNGEQRYVVNILLSMIPIGIVGVCFKDQLDALFDGSVTVVGICLLVTAALLAFAHFAQPRSGHGEISPLHAFIIGVAQAVAVLPGLSRSGSTIATGLLLGERRDQLAQFSFLMVIPPILGEALLDAKDLLEAGAEGISTTALAVGFVAAFISGCFACRVMIALVKRCKMIWFALYCAIVGAATLIWL